MKILLAAAAVLFAYATVNAQTKEGKITYEQKINIHKRLPPEAEQFKAMVPEFQTSIIELYYTPTTSLFKPAKDQGDLLPSADGGGRGRGFGRFAGGTDNTETFRDYENERVVESRELGPKRYLIEDTLQPLKWKLEDETMTISGLICHKATTTIQGFGMGTLRSSSGGRTQGTVGSTNTPAGRPKTEGQNSDTASGRNMRRDSSMRNSMAKMMDEKQEVIAWYTDQIQTSAGPDNYFGLPGLILYLDIDNGTIVYSPKKLEPLGNETVSIPTKGNKITREEYRKMMQQQFQGMPGGGRTMMFRQ
jgi:GLPGLI family protein